MINQVHKTVLTIFATRPIWGLFPVRIAFGMLIFLENMTILPGIMAAMIVFGFLGRVVGAAMVFAFLPLLARGGIEVIDVIYLSISAMFLMSGSGRFSLDRLISRSLLRRHPNPKKELYVIAETPFTDRWYE